MAWVKRFGEWHSDSCEWVKSVDSHPRRKTQGLSFIGGAACSCAHDAGEHYCDTMDFDGDCTLLSGLSPEELAAG